MIERTATIKVELTPAELAQLFCDMDADQQAKFFDEIGRCSSEWVAPFCFQLQAVIDSKFLTDRARSIMEDIGNYGKNGQKAET